jgi:anionic glutamate receptor
MIAPKLKNYSLLLVVIFLLTIAYADNADVLSKILAGKSYMTKVKPTVKRESLCYQYNYSEVNSVPCNTAVEVEINIFVRNLDEFDYDKESFRAQLTFRQQWNDPRLSYSASLEDEFLSITNASLIWTPDLFFSNALEGSIHTIITNNQLVRIYPNGNVLFSSRLSLRLKCNFVSPAFPFDKNTCRIRVASYAFTNSDVFLMWKTEAPVQMSSTLNIHGLYTANWNNSVGSSTTNTGTYGYLEVSFEIRRDTTYYYLMVYIPTSLFVFISYLAFWIKEKNSRCLVALSALLVSTMLIVNVNMNSLPKTSFIKAIDFWNGMSITFMVFTLLLLLLFENCCSERLDTQECRINDKSQCKASTKTAQRAASEWEKLVRTFYPISFLLFVFAYFSVCCLKRMP